MRLGGIMLQLRSLALATLLTLTMAGSALAEGFAMTEWSARGLSLAGGMVGRADDVSALAYNAAGITQLPGIHIMGGMSFVAPYGGIHFENTGHTTKTKSTIWTPGHGYASYQLNDKVWLGLGVFTRFGLGNNYADEWQGRYNVHGVGVTTLSAVPTIAYKFNDMFSASFGVEIMYMSMFLNNAVDFRRMGQADGSAALEGDGVGIGFHLGLHAKFNEQWSAGLAYKSQVTQNIRGEAKFHHSLPAPFAGLANIPNKSDIHGTIQLPDSLALGIMYKPLENLSFEVGAIYTRWSTFNHLNIYMDGNPHLNSFNEKNWRDGWNINASVEYAPLDWLTLRAGYWHETDVTDDKHADYLMPTNGRDVISLGVGFKYENWTFDLAYAHLWLYDVDYTKSNTSTVSPGKSSNVGADIYSFSIGYTF